MAKREPLNDTTLIGRTAAEAMRDYPRTRELSVDRLLTRPTDAIEVCRRTNLRLGRQLQHEQILNCLLNARKRGDLTKAE